MSEEHNYFTFLHAVAQKAIFSGWPQLALTYWVEVLSCSGEVFEQKGKLVFKVKVIILVAKQVTNLLCILKEFGEIQSFYNE